MSSTFFKFHQLFFSAPRQPLRRAGFQLRGCSFIRIHIGIPRTVFVSSWAAVALSVLWVGSCAPRPHSTLCAASVAALRGLWRVLPPVPMLRHPHTLGASCGCSRASWAVPVLLCSCSCLCALSRALPALLGFTRPFTRPASLPPVLAHPRGSGGGSGFAHHQQPTHDTNLTTRRPIITHHGPQLHPIASTAPAPILIHP